jgi:hypothetical protein
MLTDSTVWTVARYRLVAATAGLARAKEETENMVMEG